MDEIYSSCNAPSGQLTSVLISINQQNLRARPHWCNLKFFKEYKNQLQLLTNFELFEKAKEFDKPLNVDLEKDLTEEERKK